MKNCVVAKDGAFVNKRQPEHMKLEATFGVESHHGDVADVAMEEPVHDTRCDEEVSHDCSAPNWAPSSWSWERSVPEWSAASSGRGDSHHTNRSTLMHCEEKCRRLQMELPHAWQKLNHNANGKQRNPRLPFPQLHLLKFVSVSKEATIGRTKGNIAPYRENVA